MSKAEKPKANKAAIAAGKAKAFGKEKPKGQGIFTVWAIVYGLIYGVIGWYALRAMQDHAGMGFWDVCWPHVAGAALLFLILMINVGDRVYGRA